MVSGYAITTLVLFIFSIFCVTRPIPIPAPRFLPKISLNLTTAPIVTIFILWAAQCLNPTVIRNGIVGTEGVKPYNIIILFFSLAYMATTLDISGVLRAAAYWVSKRGGNNGWRLYLYFYVLLTVVSTLLGNDPVILSGTAFLVYYTQVAGLHPLAWVMAEFAAANTAGMVLFVGNPTNVVICEGFSINNAAFTAYTILPFVACSIFCFVALAFQYRKQVPRKLARTTHRDPWKALRDPVAACVGSFMLGTTIVLCLVASFFEVDVWKISLPFAVCKFLFDLGWDSYRVSRNIPIGLPEPEGEVGEDSDRAEEAGHPRPASPINPEARSELGPLSESTVVDSTPGTPKTELKTLSMKDSDGAQTPSRKYDSQSSSQVGHSCPASPTHPRDRTGSFAPRGIVVDSRAGFTKAGPGPVPDEMTFGDNMERPQTSPHQITPTSYPPSHPPLVTDPRLSPMSGRYHSYVNDLQDRLFKRFPTVMTVLPRLPFRLMPFIFSQFILIEALDHQGWIKIFGDWLVRASHKQVHSIIWLIGVLRVILCNTSGTSIGATILLTKVVRAAALPYDANRAAAIALAIASNVGAVSFTFSASLAGLLWQSVLEQKEIHVKQRTFAFWNLLPISVLTTVGLGVVSAEVAVLFPS